MLKLARRGTMPHYRPVLLVQSVNFSTTQQAVKAQAPVSVFKRLTRHYVSCLNFSRPDASRNGNPSNR